MKNLISVPLLVVAFMFQAAVVSRLTLLSGCADLVLLILVAWSLQEQVRSSWHWAALAGLVASFFSGLSPFVLLTGYLLSVALARYVIRQIWQTPILALFTVTFFSTLIVHFVTVISLLLGGTAVNLGDALAFVTIPSVFLNFLLVLPVHALMQDMALWVYPVEELI